MAKISKQKIGEMSALVKELGRNGATINVMALELNMGQSDLAELRKEHPEFDKAVRTALDQSLGFHEKRLIENVDNKAFSSQTATALLRSAFPDSYEGTVYRKDAAAKSIQQAPEDYKAIVADLLKQLDATG